MAKPGPKPDPTYDEHSAQRQRVNARRSAQRDIEIPLCKDKRRRGRCKNSLVKFTTTYFSKPPNGDRYPGERGLASLPLSEMHKKVLADFQERILFGGLEALAAPRGHGKDTMAIIAALWATLYGHTRFFVFACYEAHASAERIDAIKAQVETNEWLMQDFPDVCAPIRALERAAQRAKQQTFRGEYTRSEWGKTIVFPTIPGSPASGCIIAPASLSGSVRGMNIRGCRPSFVALSDPQTDESAKSDMQIEDTLRRIHKDFGGLGAVDRPLSCLALVTIIRRHDVADQITDRGLNPQWNGLRYKAIEEWPTRVDLWDQYNELRDEGSRKGDSTGREAMRFYEENRADMDAGSVVTWKDAFVRDVGPDGAPLELSALQHFMNLRWTYGEDAFLTEYQNEPVEEESFSGLTPALVANRLSMHPQFVVPPEYTSRLVQFIDVGAREIHYTVVAYAEDGRGCVVDYGLEMTYAPEGNLADPAGPVRLALERRVLDALRMRREESVGENSPYKDAEGNVLQIDLSLVDSGWLTNTVYRFVVESGPKWYATRGHELRPGSHKYLAPKVSKGRTGDNWHAEYLRGGRVLYHLNVDYWKVMVHERFAQTPETAGALSIFGNTPKEHKRFARHICSEEWNPEKNRWEQKYKWNHFLDCAVGCLAAAHMVGVRVVPPDRTRVIKRSATRPNRFTMPDGRPYLVTERR